MAEFSPVTKPELVSGTCKRVPELVENGEENLPNRYIWNGDSSFGSIDLAAPMATEIPVIDLSRLVSSSMDEQLVKLKSALSSWGCFQVVNHGIENSFLDEVHQVSREFFHLPMAEKQNYAKDPDDQEGYGDDIVLDNVRPLEWCDRFEVFVIPEDRRKLKYWPEKPESFRKVLHDYAYKLKQIEEQLLMSLARSLSLPEDCFLKRFGERPTLYARFNYYPPCSRADQVLSLRPHSDGSAITILLQDKQVEGLQVLKDNQWLRVPIMPHALFIIVGDQIEIMSNGIYKSSFHRVLANVEKERNTLAMLCAPDIEIDIEPVEDLVDEKRPRLFNKVKNYPEIFHHCTRQGKWPIDALRT